MAILDIKNSAAMKGKFGNYIARTVNGRTILCARPSHYNINHSQASTETRQRFRAANDLSKSISSLPTLKAIWEKAPNSCRTVFHTILKYNIHRSSASGPTLENIITPWGFKLPVIAAAVDKKKIIVSMQALNSILIFKPFEVNLSANAIVCFTNSVNPDDAPYQIIACSKEIPGFNFTQAYELQIDLDLRQQLLAAKYSKNILLLSVATKNAEGNVVQFSATSPTESL